jgi:UDP-N-acetyl-D-mannosaminuronic acid dehydrogenase
VRLLERELADVAIHDPHVPTPTQTLQEAVLDADAVIVATNHPEFCSPGVLRLVVEGARRDALVVDPWNCWGAAQLFAHADEILALTS